MGTENQNRRENDTVIFNRIKALEARQKVFADDLAENTKVTKNIESGQVKLQESTEELLDLFRAAKGGIRTAQWLGNFIKWTAGVAAALLGLWLTVRQFFGH